MNDYIWLLTLSNTEYSSEDVLCGVTCTVPDMTKLWSAGKVIAAEPSVRLYRAE